MSALRPLEAKETNPMWSDNEASTDFLDCGHLVGAVSSIVCNDRLLPTTIGVFGDWGSGKSSVLRMVQSELETDSGILCLSFNGWLFEGYEDAKTALMGTILDEITERRKLEPKAKELAKSLFQRVDLMKVAGLAWKHGSALAVGGPAALGLTLGGDALSILRELVAKGGDAAASLSAVAPWKGRASSWWRTGSTGEARAGSRKRPTP